MASAGNPGQQHSQQTPQRQAGGSAAPSGGAASTVQDMAQNVASAAAQRAGAVWDQTMHGAHGAGDLVGDVVQVIRRYPLAAVAVGATVGLVLARLLTPPGAGRASAASFYPPSGGYGRENYPFTK